MKRTIPLLMLVLMVISSCKKDEEDNTPANYYSLDGTLHELAEGYLAGGKVYLLSDGLSITGVEQSTGNPLFSGSGNLVSITGITGQSAITSGTYDLQNVDGDLYINWEPALTTFDHHAMINMSTGTCAIQLNGLSLSLQIDGTSMQDGKSQQVRFSGDLSEISK